MDIKLDHIVHFIEGEPDKAIEEFKKHHYKAVQGGRHETWGTYNSLLYLQSSYIEFLAVENQAIASQSDNPLISQLITDLSNGEGIGQICFRTNNIESLKRDFEENGFDVLPILPGRRNRSDGKLIQWKMLFLKKQHSMPFPFFIEWAEDDEARYKEFKQQGILDEKLVHTNIETITFQVNDIDAAPIAWATLFDVPVIKQNKVSAKIEIGGVAIIFNQAINGRGDRPYKVTFQPPLSSGEVSLYGSTYR
ncbi:glyoxalase-like protein [Cytobacillus horneckiae]|uniref:VOC family protein n=1 Tax=Cytobacillus horneckiae TaxID=549687 RepID=UPI0008260B59|nr:VOC family protein [Cytobacillus horneckiae]MBN6886905.1 VOC family protein [Cytobacillus horneckiae]MCM3177625.1 VOC family protein [Cytobacillus horneckiae]MEC1157930.1 VOC family protein [Cytobacillus horneckiae]MED2937145.1 VOC family protein [Cytobacillus horneckiae]